LIDPGHMVQWVSSRGDVSKSTKHVLIVVLIYIGYTSARKCIFYRNRKKIQPNSWTWMDWYHCNWYL
jgi:hypothetical protein